MAEDFDLYRQFGMTSPEQREAANMALITTGLGMLAGANQPRYPGQGVFGNIAQGALGGMQAYGDYRQQQAAIAQAQQLQALRQQQMQMQMEKFDREQQQREAVADLIPTLSPDMQALVKAGGPQAINALIQSQIPKTPTGYRRGEGDTLIPGMIQLPDGSQIDYATYQQQLALANAQARAQIPGYGEPERLQMAQDSAARADYAQRMQEFEMTQRLNAQEEQREIARERLELSKQAAERGKKLVTPMSAISAFNSNEEQLRKIDAALDAVEKTPRAFGAHNLAPNALLQRADLPGFKEGVDARDKVSKLGNIEIKDMSGATVTPQEFVRHGPSYPAMTDDPEKIKQNLRNMREAVLNQQRLMQNTFTSEQYKTPLSSTFKKRPGPRVPTDGWKIEEVK